MEQIEKLAKLVNMEPVLVILIGVGLILIVFGLGAAITAKRRKRITRSKEKALKNKGGMELLPSSCKKISESFATILQACPDLPGGDDFLKKDEVASALRDLAGALAPKAAPASKRKKGSNDLSLRDYSYQTSEDSSIDDARKSMVRIIRALYMDRQLLKQLKEGYPGELKEAVESLTE